MFTYPYFIELVHGLFNEFRVISQDACFKIASSFSLHANSRTREVSTSYICHLAIINYHLEMDTRAQHAFQAIIQYGVLIKVLTKVGARFLRMNKPHLHTLPNQFCQQGKKRPFLPFIINIGIVVKY